MNDLIHNATECKPAIDAAELARTKRSSPARFNSLFQRYRRLGFTEREIVAAMARSPVLVDPIGRGR
jgi:hypothetical protein